MTNDAPQGAEPEHGSETAAAHPEEMRATVDLRIGNSISIKATARATPAGLIAAALLISVVLIPAVWLFRTPAREPIRVS